MKKMYFSFNGKVNRRDFLGYGLVIPTLIIAIAYMSANAAGIVMPPIVINLWLFLMSLAPSVKRLHDLQLSGWSVCLKFVPPFTLTMLLMLLFAKGLSDEQLEELGVKPNWVPVP